MGRVLRGDRAAIGGSGTHRPRQNGSRCHASLDPETRSQNASLGPLQLSQLPPTPPQHAALSKPS